MQQTIENKLAGDQFKFQFNEMNFSFEEFTVSAILEEGQMVEFRLKIREELPDVYELLESDLCDIVIDKEDLEGAATIDFDLVFDMTSLMGKEYIDHEMSEISDFLELQSTDGEKPVQNLNNYSIVNQRLQS